MLVLFNFGDRIKEKGLVLTQKVFLSGFLGYQKRKEKKRGQTNTQTFHFGSSPNILFNMKQNVWVWFQVV